MATLNVFNDVTEGTLPTKAEDSIAGGTNLSNLLGLLVGAGGQTMRVDQSGLWLGAEKFSDAPFSVDMDGNVIASSADFSGAGYSKITIFKQDGIPTSISIGDLWFDTDDGNKLYRAASVGATTIAVGAWELVASTTISIFAQDAIPTSLAVGDLWYDTNDNNKVYRAASVGADAITAGEWVAVDDQRAADALLKSGASQVLSGDIQVGTGDVKIDGANGRITIITSGTPSTVIGNV